MSFKVHCSVYSENDSNVISFNELEDYFMSELDMEDICNNTICFLRDKFKKEIDNNILDFYSCSDNLIECFIKKNSLERTLMVKIIMSLKKHPEIEFSFSN